ncbi:MAG TPA: DEAD/DEAH box helicase family protein [Edaphocola sp.]|nr:DEAD/DEAH box helicase family protein [Edaphocola sp.]
MKIKFESDLAYQEDAIQSIVDVFRGQDVCTANFTVVAPRELNKGKTTFQDELGYGNKLQLTEAQVLENIQEIQLRNGLKPSKVDEVEKSNYDFSVEMETGTGKTYVYLRSIMEMNKRYGYKKFIIVVPSVAIREGTYKSLQMTHAHLKELYDNVPYRYFIYDSANLSQVRDFAISDQLQIMVITIQAFAKDLSGSSSGSKRILLEYNDKLGAKPISLLQNTRPIVIVDEPQSTLSSALQKKSVKNLHPLALFRYSATHKEKVNLLYKLDAIDAYSQKLVKQIEVASVKTEGAANEMAFIKLVSVSNKNGMSAKLELDVKDKSGKAKRTVKVVKQNEDLLQLTGLPQYTDFYVRNIYIEQDYIEFSNGIEITTGSSYGALDDLIIKRTQIAKTIEEHLDKELRLNPLGIKVLSLFFIDAVANYKVYDEEGNASNGIYAQMFEEEYTRLIALHKYKSLFEEEKNLETDASKVHKGYFSIDKKAKSSNKKERFEYFKDTTGSVKADEDTYNLIMRDKEKLLGFKEKLRFIFSHSALKEGWDNPNVFQICTLKEAGGSETRRRQEIGRGLRLAVNQNGERVYGFDVNTLTVMASESYEDFVTHLQKEIEDETGIKFGFLEEHSFSNVIAQMNGNTPIYLGHEESEDLFNHLLIKGYIDTKGKIQDMLRIDLKDGKVDLGKEYEIHIENQLLEVLKKTAGKLEVKDHADKMTIKLNKKVYLSPEFKELWDRIKYKTTFRVNYDSKSLIEKCIQQMDSRIVISGGRVIFQKALVQFEQGGLLTTGESDEVYGLKAQVTALPDIITYLQNETQLTRRSLVAILVGISKRTLGYFKVNPQKFIEASIEIINEQMRLHIVDGIVYTKKIGEDTYYSQELFKNEELSVYLKSNMVASTKSPYCFTITDSLVESRLAAEFEQSKNIKLYTKLPSWFKIDTPLGTYNPDWAVLYVKDGTEELYFVVESKGTLGMEFLRPAEQGRIDCGKKHFEELGSKLITATEMKDVYDGVLGGE